MYIVVYVTSQVASAGRRALLSSKYDTCKTVMARLWPQVKIFTRLQGGSNAAALHALLPHPRRAGRSGVHTASDRTGNTLNYFHNFYLKAQTVVWP